MSDVEKQRADLVELLASPCMVFNAADVVDTFIATIRAEAREECAKIAEEHSHISDEFDIAAAIRSAK